MPMVIISGFPSSGKSTRAKQLKEYLTNKGKLVEIVSENVSVPKNGFHKNECFADFQKEKIVRSDLKSETLRILNKENVVIIDAMDYIKGYRYELFCGTKAAQTTQCVLFCGIQNDKAWNFNMTRKTINEQENLEEKNDSEVPYSREIFDALCMRYEEPNGNCRWDNPLFVTFPEDELDLEGIYNALFSKAPLPPNQSTQNLPLSSTNYLFELDKVTKEIVIDVIAARKIGIYGPVPVKNCKIKVDIPHTLNAMQLNKLRRQFITYSKMHSSGSSLEQISQLFVQFLNSNHNK